ncbi:hypothetical protein Dsin_006888 [Dipteronia sinensis]|uniref:Dof zinc finger protein n=1 Tax=Dipteronia sinensis TaxID=43782 RepID=A0AAE0AZG8_9ROSI|nr:hypothetical protein Dsin_006888 [Dipteronia sinensis]
MMERAWKPNVEITPNCPRCGSSNTKFCYYNNYSLTQPRYFCKGCRRYWTKGGSLRNVPVGGGCRKNRRSGKSVRFSTDHHGVSSKSNLAYGGGGSSINGHSNYCNKVVGSPSSPGGHNIDLALVYANFLNQQPVDTKTGSATALENIPDFPGGFDPLVEFSNMCSTNLEEENGVVGGMSMGADLSMEAHLSDSTSDQQNYYSHVFDSVHKQQGGALLERLCTSRNQDDQELPPLPNDEEILWLNNSDHHTLEDQPMLGPDQLLQDPNLLFGNWTTPFDFSTDDPTFTKIT